jgi:hypothetical protein
MWAVYQIEDGRLVSTGSTVADDAVLAARGYGKVEIASANGVWNPARLAFDPAPSEAIEIEPDVFLDQFTPAETARIYGSPDAVLQKFLRRLSIRRLPIDLSGETVTGGLAYVASLGLFDDQNGVPGAPTARPVAIQGYRP